jgi:hypothetical protein
MSDIELCYIIAGLLILIVIIEFANKAPIGILVLFTFPISIPYLVWLHFKEKRATEINISNGTYAVIKEPRIIGRDDNGKLIFKK